MNEVGLKICKEEINDLITYIEQLSQLDKKTIEYYRVIAKQTLFFKHILNAYPQTYFVEVLISDFFNFILNDINESTRYLYLNERSIIENYIRLILKKDEYISHITSQSFVDLKEQNRLVLNESEYSKIMNEYKISCSYIHGGNILANHLVANFEECVNGVNDITKRNKANRMNQTLDLFKILNKLFIINNLEVVDNSFHRNKYALNYLLGKQYSLLS
ncbi:hypothetical protein KD050_05005 [Psychrobacillus sp. INOP01]|uniref:hypothetical protein n=1 Tax=Psychrobacillus sp. INOP01 TaxID=2829187 RepID=UPI001BA8A044|nr:hypothetical protein [Psychrobacillus sp. INOP01]QUG42635.1 hypothetical protein KD050_05005 [Psychrobacillus sp. INOP01]